ncbi:MAG: 5-formyltetrahydrofolate cyclo-ligase [Legionella sp.]|nr:MAG: 5-formyltetrahydrofolate cyclo-ligase [Legionella sp.]
MSDQYKDALRSTIRQVRSKLSSQYRATASEQVCTRIRSLAAYKDAQHVALYHSIHGEIDLTSLWHSADAQGKTCYFPVLHDNSSLLFLPASPITPFRKNKFGVLEPDISRDLAMPVDKLDLILVPVVVFDIRCTRLGMGAGYYDRTLANQSNSTLYGIAYQFQRVDYIEPESWDVPLDAVITQRAIYWREAD